MRNNRIKKYLCSPNTQRSQHPFRTANVFLSAHSFRKKRKKERKKKVERLLIYLAKRFDCNQPGLFHLNPFKFIPSKIEGMCMEKQTLEPHHSLPLRLGSPLRSSCSPPTLGIFCGTRLCNPVVVAVVVVVLLLLLLLQLQLALIQIWSCEVAAKKMRVTKHSDGMETRALLDWMWRSRRSGSKLSWF